MIHQTNEQGMTLDELYDVLYRAVAEGYGERRLLIGPLTDIDPESDFPITAGKSVTGVEINDANEKDICWLYAGDLEI